ncbi:NAD(+) diphosphatase, partial [uncultured Micrococcus sp.]|uniref:NAD(+) diphosphatase n=1 Tax=uncultured Micrococcus sp. TaxID=114051 RepID=UPI00260040C5
MPERPRPATRPAPRPADGSASLPPLPLPLAREAVDRAGLEREVPGLLDRLWQEAGTEVLHLRGGRAPVRDGALVTVSPAGPLPSGAVFLGRRERAEGQAPAAVVLVAHEDGAGAGSTPEPAPGPLPADMAWVGLRDVAAGLSDADAGLFTAAVSVTHWHASHGFCPRCGGPTAVESAGWVRRCTACSAQHFPRTDPAVIMAVTDDDDRLLLGSNAAWPAGRHSCLAGFVEPGES